MVKIGYYVPLSHLEKTKNALFDSGAGRIGNYDQCCWQCLGQGQFRPNELSKPVLGSVNRLEVVEEYRVEMVCTDALWADAITALKKAHPYEELAYDVVPLLETQ